MIRDILAFVDESLVSPTRFSLPTNLAKRFHARLSACHVFSIANPVIGPELRAEAAAALNAQIEIAEGVTKRVRNQYWRGCEENDIKGDWHVAKSWEAGFSLAARHDLVVVGESTRDTPRLLNRRVPEDIAMGVGRPTLVVPTWGTFETCGNRVVIAWKATREAGRAVHDAIPLIAEDAVVTIVEVPEGNEEDPAERPSSDDLRLHLARHGITASIETFPLPQSSISDLILDRAKQHEADLIVMGLYGHSRAQELLLGGVSRSMLRDMSVPLLLSR